MANKRFYNADSYGQFEPNNCSFMRTGRVEAQCKPASDFTTSLPLENGMLVAVDKVTNTIELCAVTEARPIGIVYSAEKIYDSDAPGLKNFKMTDDDGFYPRVGYLLAGDTFTTNTIAAGYTDAPALEAAIAAMVTTPLYGAYTTDLGAILVSTSAPTVGPVLKVVKKTTMPDGTNALKFQVLSV